MNKTQLLRVVCACVIAVSGISAGSDADTAGNARNPGHQQVTSGTADRNRHENGSEGHLNAGILVMLVLGSTLVGSALVYKGYNLFREHVTGRGKQRNSR